MEKTIELLKGFQKRDRVSEIGRPITRSDFNRAFNECEKLNPTEEDQCPNREECNWETVDVETYMCTNCGEIFSFS